MSGYVPRKCAKSQTKSQWPPSCRPQSLVLPLASAQRSWPSDAVAAHSEDASSCDRERSEDGCGSDPRRTPVKARARRAHDRAGPADRLRVRGPRRRAGRDDLAAGGGVPGVRAAQVVHALRRGCGVASVRAAHVDGLSECRGGRGDGESQCRREAGAKRPGVGVEHDRSLRHGGRPVRSFGRLDARSAHAPRASGDLPGLAELPTDLRRRVPAARPGRWPTRACVRTPSFRRIADWAVFCRVAFAAPGARALRPTQAARNDRGRRRSARALQVGASSRRPGRQLWGTTLLAHRQQAASM
jgi:hypothetical protein